ncbi:MFS general substrate transporter [Meredithblackwellia eburnea MCA 4105]
MQTSSVDEKTSTGAPAFDELEKDNSNVTEAAAAVDIVEAAQEYTPAQYRRLVLKTDLIILPMLWLCWGLVQADKGSTSQQATFGLQTSAHLHGQQFAMLTTLFFIAYFVAEFPANWLMQKTHLGRTVGVLMLLWGCIVLAIGFCHNYAQLAALRFIQGILECSVGPAFLIITGSFYTTKELILRAFVWGTAPFSFGAASNIAIYFIAKKAQENDAANAWRSISYFLGGLTIFAAIAAFFLLGTPREVMWMSAEEKRMSAARTASNQTGTDSKKQPWDNKQAIEALCDPQTFFFFFCTLVNGLPNSGVQTFGNLVLKSFGFSSLDSILKGTLPINIYQWGLYLIMGFLTLRYTRIRFYLMIGSLIPSVICLFLLAFIPTTHSNRLGKFFLYMLGQTGGIAGFLIQCFVPSNVAGRTKKTVVLTVIFCAYAAGNSIGPQVFRSTDAPRYIKGISVSASMYAVELALMVLWRVYYAVENRRRDRAAEAAGITKEERERLGTINAEMGMTDRQNPHFRYSV